MHVLTELDRDRIAEFLARDEFFWLDLVSPTSDDLGKLGEILALHPVAVEALGEFPERPRLDPYETYAVLIFYGVGGEGRDPLEPIEGHLLVSGSYVVTVHRESYAHLERLRDHFSRGGVEGSEEFIVYKILDVLADSFFPALAAIDEEIDELEDAIVSHAGEAQLQRIFELKRELVRLRQIATPQRDLLASTIDQITELPGFQDDTRDYFRAVYDHMIRVSDLIDSYRDLLTGALDVYLSTVSNRLNAVMERLTIVATIFLPLSVVTGFFGMNFGWMVRHINSFAAFVTLGIGGVVVCVALLLLLFWRAGYLGTRAAHG
jgi:magnesium transporter